MLEYASELVCKHLLGQSVHQIQPDINKFYHYQCKSTGDVLLAQDGALVSCAGRNPYETCFEARQALQGLARSPILWTGLLQDNIIYQLLCVEYKVLNLPILLTRCKKDLHCCFSPVATNWYLLIV